MKKIIFVIALIYLGLSRTWAQASSLGEGFINPVNERLTKTNIRSDGATPKVPSEPWKVKPSGLFGPVRLLVSLEVEVR
jgi:hypothetical protein